MNKKMYATVFGLVFELVGLVILFLYAGRYIDNKMHWSGIGVTFGGILAIVIWLLQLIKTFKNKENIDE